MLDVLQISMQVNNEKFFYQKISLYEVLLLFKQKKKMKVTIDFYR